MPLRRGAHDTRRRSESLATEVAPFGVRVCTLEPGGIRTNWARRAGQKPPGPWKIADVIVQLANSDEVPVRLILVVDAEKWVQRSASCACERGREMAACHGFNGF
jgi:NAD(P)-dependent dehydrogenase (short-subunit alcohol dehydrogenase family)